MVGDKYIKMCREAKELQEAWELKIGDRFQGKILNPSIFYVIDKWIETNDAEVWYCRAEGGMSGFVDEGTIKRNIWLPYQEQLQKLIPEDKWGWAMELLEGYCSDPDEMEYGWLEIYMQIVHNEEWNSVTETWDELEDD